VFLDFLQR
jgi:hypothetical protein